jgi:hypothetical protein
LITIGEARFHLDAPDLDDQALRDYATALFVDFDVAVADLLQLSDYGIHLDIEEGSIKGYGKVFATAATLYFSIGHFGDFVQGVQEISRLMKAAVGVLLEEAPKKLGQERFELTWKRSDTGKLGRVERLFYEVKAGTLEPAVATRRVLEILGEEDEVPENVAAEIATSIEKIKLDPKQIDLPWSTEEGVEMAVSQPERPRQRKPTADKVALTSHKLRIEVHKDGKHGRTIVRVIHLD